MQGCNFNIGFISMTQEIERLFNEIDTRQIEVEHTSRLQKKYALYQQSKSKYYKEDLIQALKVFVGNKSDLNI